MQRGARKRRAMVVGTVVARAWPRADVTDSDGDHSRDSYSEVWPRFDVGAGEADGSGGGDEDGGDDSDRATPGLRPRRYGAVWFRSP
jgi:hypothetical protein